MPTTLNSGLQLPDKGSVDWYSSMQTNYGLLDNHLEDTVSHVTAEDKDNWNSKQGSLSQDQLDAIAQVATNTDDIAALQSGKANVSHTHSSSDITDIDDYATKDYVDNSISGLVDNAPDALNTLNELSAALNDDSNFAGTVTTALAAKANSADLATVATSGSYNDLDDLPTIPTNTSDLTNDSDFVVSSNLATVATSGDYDDLSNKPSIPTNTSDLTNDSNFVDTSNSAVASGITSAKVSDYDTHIADTDIHVTTADKATWNTVTSKANDSDVVHRSGDETVGGVKTFADTPVFTSFDGIRFRCAHNSNAYITFGDSNQANPGSLILSAHDGNVGTTIHLVGKTLIPYNNNDTDLGSSSRSWKDFYSYHGYFRGQQQNDEYSSNARTNLTLTANRDILGQSGCLIDTFRENTSQGTGSHILGFGIKENSVRYQGCRLSWFYDNDNNGYVFALRPTTQGSNQPIKYELGTSSAKWSTINGLEPSSLGMPDLSNGIDISSYLINIGTSTPSEYTPSVNGWLVLKIASTQGYVSIRVSSDNGIDNYSYSERSDAGGLATDGGYTYEKFASCITPCIKNDKLDIYILPSMTSVVSAYFYPCLGNV